MSYKVIKYFTDMQDNDFEYNEGDIFPREDLKVLPSRIKELSTTQNRRKEILIVEVPDEEKPKKEKKTKPEKTDEE
jgi:hypothetical protein